MSEKRFCRDCKHFNGMSPYPPLCVHPDSYQDPVFGSHSTCSLMRSDSCLITPRCGAEGRWFEPNEADSDGGECD